MELQSASEEHATAAERRRASKSTRESLVGSRIVTAYLRKGNANLLGIVPGSHGPLEAEGGFRESCESTSTMQRARGDDDDIVWTSGTYVEGELAVRRSLEESFSHVSVLQLEMRWSLSCVSTGRMSKLSV